MLRRKVTRADQNELYNGDELFGKILTNFIREIKLYKQILKCTIKVS